ncbi:MAG TPA: hypothetical protein VLH19_01185 [Patescibacteria group bacterium]|nr:hypothetical protein [Patescibacteria group bacterium]
MNLIDTVRTFFDERTSADIENEARIKKIEFFWHTLLQQIPDAVDSKNRLGKVANQLINSLDELITDFSTFGSLPLAPLSCKTLRKVPLLILSQSVESEGGLQLVDMVDMDEEELNAIRASGYEVRFNSDLGLPIEATITGEDSRNHIRLRFLFIQEATKDIETLKREVFSGSFSISNPKFTIDRNEIRCARGKVSESYNLIGNCEFDEQKLKIFVSLSRESDGYPKGKKVKILELFRNSIPITDRT